MKSFSILNLTRKFRLDCEQGLRAPLRNTLISWTAIVTAFVVLSYQAVHAHSLPINLTDEFNCLKAQRSFGVSLPYLTFFPSSPDSFVLSRTEYVEYFSQNNLNASEPKLTRYWSRNFEYYGDSLDYQLYYMDFESKNDTTATDKAHRNNEGRINSQMKIEQNHQPRTFVDTTVYELFKCDLLTTLKADQAILHSYVLEEIHNLSQVGSNDDFSALDPVSLNETFAKIQQLRRELESMDSVCSELTTSDRLATCKSTPYLLFDKENISKDRSLISKKKYF